MDLWGFKYSDRKLLMCSLQLCSLLFVNLDVGVVMVFRVHSVVNSKNLDEWSFWLVSRLVGLFRSVELVKAQEKGYALWLGLR